MLTATLGGLIKDYRIKKRLSQQEVSLRIGWSDCSRLSKIEQGRVGKITKPTLDKIMDALELTEQEKGQMLLASGILPTKEEAAYVINRLKATIKNFNCPIILIDFAWYIYFVNEQASKMLKLTPEEFKSIHKKTPHWFEMFFSRKNAKKVEIGGGLNDKKILDIGEHDVALFKYEQVGNTEDKWYRSMLTKMNKESAIFRELWQRVKPYGEEHMLYEYEVDTYKSIWNGKEETLSFNLFSIHPSMDFRFYLMIYQPADEITSKFYSQI